MKTMKKWLYVLMVLLIAGCGGGAQVAAAGWQEQYDMGVRFLSESNYEEAVLAFTAAIEIDTKQPLAYVGRGDAYVGLEQYENAVPDYEQAITLDESVAEVYLKLADTYESLGDPAAAEDTLRRGYEATGDEAISILLGIEDEDEEGSTTESAAVLPNELMQVISQLKTAALNDDHQTAFAIWQNVELFAYIEGLPISNTNESEGVERDAIYSPDTDDEFTLWYWDTPVDSWGDEFTSYTRQEQQYSLGFWQGGKDNGIRIHCSLIRVEENEHYYEPQYNNENEAKSDFHNYEYSVWISKCPFVGSKANGEYKEIGYYWMQSENDSFYDGVNGIFYDGQASWTGSAMAGLRQGAWMFEGYDTFTLIYDEQGRVTNYVMETQADGLTRSVIHGVNGELNYMMVDPDKVWEVK